MAAQSNVCVLPAHLFRALPKCQVWVRSSVCSVCTMPSVRTDWGRLHGVCSPWTLFPEVQLLEGTLCKLRVVHPPCAEPVRVKHRESPPVPQHSFNLREVRCLKGTLKNMALFLSCPNPASTKPSGRVS